MLTVSRARPGAPTSSQPRSYDSRIRLPCGQLLPPSEAAARSGLNLSEYGRRRLTAADTLAEERDALRQAVRHLSQISETHAAALETALLVRATARPEHIAIAQAAIRRRGIEHLSD